MRTASNRFSSPKGTTTRNYEIVGHRPGYDDFAELLIVTNDLERFRNSKIHELCQGLFEDGYSEIRILQPGDVRPVDVLQIEDTELLFWDCEESWFDRFCEDFDRGDYGKAWKVQGRLVDGNVPDEMLGAFNKPFDSKVKAAEALHLATVQGWFAGGTIVEVEG